MNGFLERLAAAEGHQRLLLIGDLNAYAAEDPTPALTREEFVDLMARAAAGAALQLCVPR